MDNCSQFKGKLMAEVFEVFHTHDIYTSSYHYQPNGQVEQFKGTLMFILRKLAQERHEICDKYLLVSLSAYRGVLYQSMVLPPATLLFRRPIKGSLEALIRTWTEEKLCAIVMTVSKSFKN